MTTRLIKSSGGFSLIELAIALVIISILAVFVYPSYLEQVKKGRRADAKIALVELAQLQEDYYADNNKYAENFSTLLRLTNPGDEVHGFKLHEDKVNILSKDEYYVISYDAASTLSSFILQARPSVDKSQTSDEHCSWFKIEATGRKTAKNDDCW